MYWPRGFIKDDFANLVATSSGKFFLQRISVLKPVFLQLRTLNLMKLLTGEAELHAVHF